MKRIRVLIVEDSRVVRELLEHIIGRDPRLEIAASVGSAEEALDILEKTAPDVISMDIRLPGMDGFEATQRIMMERPTPVVVVSASVEREDLQIAMNALRAGALTVLEKPSGTASIAYESLAERLCTQLAIMSQVKVVRRRVARAAYLPERRAHPRSGSYRVLGIASSTGGPNALIQLLNALGPDFPLPILLVQHITASFLEGFASWLQKVTPFSVELVTGRTLPQKGKVYIASRDRHLRVRHDGVYIDSGEPVSAQRPSGTVLFQSIAATYGNQAIGVLLTGMGDDGAAGLVDVRKAGGHTIAEHESTAVVYGMPAEAVRLGAACESLPLPAIAPRLLDLTCPRKEVA